MKKLMISLLSLCFLATACSGTEDQIQTPTEEDVAEARDDARSANLEQLETALDLYFEFNDSYPITDSNGDCVKDGLAALLIDVISSVPTSEPCFRYSVDPDGQSYTLN